MQPHIQQPTRLPRPWDSPGKNTGVGCHFLLQCMTVNSESEVAQSCLTLSDPMDCSLPGSSIHGIFQARLLEWGAIDCLEITCWLHAFLIFPSRLIYHGKHRMCLTFFFSEYPPNSFQCVTCICRINKWKLYWTILKRVFMKGFLFKCLKLSDESV